MTPVRHVQPLPCAALEACLKTSPALWPEPLAELAAEAQAAELRTAEVAGSGALSAEGPTASGAGDSDAKALEARTWPYYLGLCAQVSAAHMQHTRPCLAA